MAHTDITITNDAGVLVPSSSSVPVVDGDTVAFSTTDGSSVVLFFSPGAVSVLSPVPTGPVTFAGGEKASFAFTSSEAGAYSVFFKPGGSPPPSQFPVRESNELLLEIDSRGQFGGPINPINTGG